MSVSRSRLGALALAALLLAGCGGSDAGSMSAGDAGGEAVAAPEPAAPAAGGDGAFAGAQDADKAAAGSAPDAATGTLPLADAATLPRSIVRTGQITVEVDTLGTSVARVRQLALDARGFVASETTGFGQPVDPIPLTENDKSALRSAGTGESVIVIRVPEPRFTATLDAIGAIGTEQSRTSSAEDVTGQVADLTSRTATAKASVDRVRALLAEAKELEDVVLLEGELTRREADLEAYQAQLASLSGLAELSTITAVLRTPEASTEEPNALFRGLERGWDAVQQSTTVLLVLIGALLPFALVLALVLVPIWLLLRRRRRPVTAAPRPAGPATPDDPDLDPTPSGDPVPAGSRT